MSNKLHFYTKYSKEKIKISDKPFASGGEGAIYAIASPRSYSHLVAKIYYPIKRTTEREEKMQYLMQHPPITFQKGQPPSIGWVQDLIYKDKEFIGILLIRINGKKLTKLTLFKLPRRADKAWERFAFKQPDAFKLRLRTCFNLAVVIHQIHESGQYVLVDLKPDNVLMQPNGLLAIVDMDSVEVVKDGLAIFSAPVATPEYTPPEHYLGERETIEETWDHFSLGVIFYQLLLGLHPFAASCNSPYDNLVSIHDKIENDLYVHHSEKQAFFKVIPPPHQQFDKIPLEIQQLFQSCFEHGSKDPSLRPSAGDWCNVLADVLKLPFKKIPKTNIPPSNSYFSPTVLVEALSLAIPALPDNNSIPNFRSKAVVNTPPKFQKQTLVDELKEAYIYNISKHREYLLQTILVGVILIVLLYNSIPLFILGLVISLLFAPQLFLDTFQNGVENIGKTILSQSTYQFLQSNKKGILVEKKVKSNKRLINTLLFEQEKAFINAKQQLSNNKKTNRLELNFIQEHLRKRTDLEQKMIALNHWAKTEEHEVSITREAELEQYKTANEDFISQLKQDERYQDYDFSSFRNLRVKIQQRISKLKGRIANNYTPLKQLELNQQKKLAKLTNIDYTSMVESHGKDLRAKARKVLKIFREKNQSINEHKEAYWAFTQKKKKLKNSNHQQQQQIEHQLNKSLQKIRKDLGLRSKSELVFYMDLLGNSQEELQLDFAAKETRRQFDLLIQKIKAINIDPIFSAEIIKTLTEATLPTANFDSPQKTKTIRGLSDLQQDMLSTSAINTTKLKEFDAALDKLTKYPTIGNGPVEMAYWAKAGQEQLSNILFNLNVYAESQSVFYGDPVIFRLRNKLQSHREEAQKGTQEIKRLKEDYLSKVKRLEDDNIPLIEKQKELDDLIEEQKQLILEKEKSLEASVVKETAAYLNSLKEQETKVFEDTKEEFQEEFRRLEKRINGKRANILIKLNKAENTLEQLALDHAGLKTATDTIRANAELVYIKKRLLSDQKCQELTDLVDQIQTEHPKIEELNRKNALYYQALKVATSDYEENLNDLNELQEEKIRLDTLAEWQKAYSSRIYIKDLLLNKVEQLEHYEQKKK